MQTLCDYARRPKRQNRLNSVVVVAAATIIVVSTPPHTAYTKQLTVTHTHTREHVIILAVKLHKKPQLVCKQLKKILKRFSGQKSISSFRLGSPIILLFILN